MDKQQKETGQAETILLKKVSVDYPPKKRGLYLTNRGYVNYRFHRHHVETWEQFYDGKWHEVKPEFWLKEIQEPNKSVEIDKMIHCIKQSAVCVNETPDTKWLIEILLKNAEEIKNEGQQRQVKQISEKRIEEIAEYLINSVQKAENHNFTGNLDKYYKGCIDGIKAALKELNNG